MLTDTGVYYSSDGEEFKRFSIRDGMGVERLRGAKIETAIITREKTNSVKRRAEKLKLRYLYVGVKNKRAHLSIILNQAGLSLNQLAYIGDDVNDLEIIESINSVGVTAAPADAMPAVLDAVHYHCGPNGGHGAFRDFAEWILHLNEN